MNIYIDCGVNKGSDINMFRKMYNEEEWRIIGFEPAPDCLKFLKTQKPEGWLDNIELIEAGVADRNGKMTFYEGKQTVSGSLRSDKTSYMRGTTVTVDVVDFAEFLDQFSEDDYIIVSMDIEGGEYDVIDHLIRTDKLKMINEIYVEYHTTKLKNNEKQREARLTEAMNEQIGKDNVYIMHQQNHAQFYKLIKT